MINILFEQAVKSNTVALSVYWLLIIFELEFIVLYLVMCKPHLNIGYLSLGDNFANYHVLRLIGNPGNAAYTTTAFCSS